MTIKDHIDNIIKGFIPSLDHSIYAQQLRYNHLLSIQELLKSKPIFESILQETNEKIEKANKELKEIKSKKKISLDISNKE